MENFSSKIVLIYAHADRDFLKRSRLISFLEGLARQEGWVFWWDMKLNNPLFDEEIKQRLEEADIIVALISQPFLESVYIAKVESKIANALMRDEGILIVPVLLEESLWEHEQWLQDIHHFPESGYLRGNRRPQTEVFAKIAEYIRAWYHGRVLPFQNPQMLYTLRSVSDNKLTVEQRRILRRDSCKRARKRVSDSEKREKICERAKAQKEKNKGKPLSKRQLEALDKEFLAGKSRKPDAEIVRWVLRCCGLHPQGRVPTKRSPKGNK